MQLTTVRIEKPADMNIVLGMSHFIRSVEDLHEACATSVPGIKFGLAFCEASGDCLVRHSGNDEELRDLSARNIQAIGAGHVFLVMLRNAFPIHVLRALREVPEVCRIFCATANPIEVIVAETELGRGVVGVIDGQRPRGIEGPEDVEKRHRFLRAVGLKL